MASEDIEVIQASFERAMSFLKSGDPGMAKEICDGALKDFPGDGNLRCLLAVVLNKQYKFKEAETELRRVIKHYPDFAKAHQELGKSLMAQRQVDDAIKSFREAVKLNPTSSSAHFRLASALARIGDQKGADEAMEKSFALRPDKKELADGIELQRAGKLKEAEQVYRRVLSRDPDNVDALRMLASIASELNHFQDAASFLRRAVAIAPDYFAAWTDLATTLLEHEAFTECLDVVERAIKLEPELAYPRMLLGNLYAKWDRYEEATQAYTAALERQPDHGGSLVGLGHALKTIGHQQDAIRAYRRCLHTYPAFGEVYWSLANLKTFRFKKEEVINMERNIDNPDLTEESRINIIFALGKAYEDRGDYDDAFKLYDRGCLMRRNDEYYDPVHTEAIHDRIVETFSAEFLKEKADLGDPDNSAIFIVGLPRSGSTLIEQILASHSQVEGTRELPDLGKVIRRINRERPGGDNYPEAVRQFGERELKMLGKQYLDSTVLHRTGKPFFTDKMPNNFPTAGLLKLILPNAKVINARRHPLDSCMGSFKQLFFKGQGFTYDLLELGEYYRQYLRVIDHWHKVLPGFILDVDYEDMVTDTDAQIRRLLEFLELPFEESCLRFYETDRAVTTASSEQVRQPIYTGSIDSWRKFEKYLGPLVEILEPVLKEFPEERQPESLKKKA